MTSWCHRATCARIDAAVVDSGGTRAPRPLRARVMLAIVLLAPGTHARAESDWSSDTELRLRVDLHHGAADARASWFGRTGLEGDLAGATLRVEAEGEWTSTPWGSSERLDLGEAHMTWNGSWGTLRLGRQQVAWGRADGFRLLDEVNPQRYPQALYGETQDARIPLWLANWENEAGPLQWQLLAGRGRELEAADPAYPQLGGRLRDAPRHRGDDHLLGARVGTLVADMDVAAYWLDSPDPRPPIRVDAGGMWQEPVRRRLAGISLDRPVATAVVRVEATHVQSQRLAGSGERVPSRMNQALVGLDLRPGTWFVSPQLYRESGTGGGALSTASGDRHYASLVVQRAWLQDRLSVRGFWMGGIERSDYWASLRVAYQWGPRFEWRVHWDRFGGAPDSALGALDGLDRFGVEAVAHF